jgi:hypothetical protein
MKTREEENVPVKIGVLDREITSCGKNLTNVNT